MATDHNFRVKNGLEVGGNLIVNSSGNLTISSGTIKLDGDFPTGARNVALGDEALNGITNGGYNVAIGSETLKQLTSATNNTAIGRAAAQTSPRP